MGESEKEETCRSMTYSCVALVSFTMCVRRSEESGWEVPCNLIVFRSWMTVCGQER